ncbi:MAG: transglycosylase SLT domain-containing protein [Gallionella sp.]|nr:transglycosylase SLT domain-containing protein [Gallionella sp.]
MEFILYFLLLIASSARADQPAGWVLQPFVKEMPPNTLTVGGFGAGNGAPTGVALADDSDFRAAQDAFRAGDAVKLERFAKRLEKSPLEVYVSYYRLRLDLENADSGMVESFLSRPEGTPMIDRLRGEWLKLLGKNQQWDMFDAEYPRLLNKDTELTCYALQSHHRNQEQAALREARGLWFNGKDQPESCGVLFESALSAGIISEQDVLRRLRLALEAGNVSLAKKLAERLNGNYAGLSVALESASADVDIYLEKLTQDKPNAISKVKPGGEEQMTQAVQPARPEVSEEANAVSPKKWGWSDSQRIVALFALHRLAKQSPELAAARWANLAAYFPVTEQQYFYGWLAYEAARNQDGRSLQWFKDAANTPLNELQSAWRVRAALRAQDWPEVFGNINAMSAQQQREAAWLYWKARALQELGKPVEARNLFALLSGEFHFYGQLAGDELADTPVLSETMATYKPDQQAIDAMLGLPGIQRTLALYRMGLYSDALEEWRWVLRNFNDRELLTAAEIARRNKMYDRAIGAADRTVSVHDFSLRYLAPYRDALQTHIREHGLEEAWVYGLMRQESRFASSAKSDVGAAGLMQIMPATARWVAGKLGLKSYRNTLIHQLDTNLRLGTYYMKSILSQFEGNPVLASAAYNAGPRRAGEWRGEQSLEGAIYAETIPFEETREYVKKVMSNTVYYARQFNAPPRSLKQRMGIVAARPADSQQATSDEM